MKDTIQEERQADTNMADLERTFTAEGLQNILGFLHCLKDIQDRLLREGYTIVGDEFVPPITRRDESSVFTVDTDK